MATNRDDDYIEQSRSTLVDLGETKTIVQGLLADLKVSALKDLFKEVQTLVNGLNVYNSDSLDPWSENRFVKNYYAVHFEAIDFNYALGKKIIYLGFGIDCDMQKNILGFWLKHDYESYFHFWLRVFEQLKQSGMQSIELGSAEDCYLQYEARSRIFG